MADISVFRISGGVSDIKETSEITAAAASQTVPQTGKDSRLALRVANGNSAGITVKIVASGGGPRAALGDMNVAVPAISTEYIALFDTARYKDLSTGDIAVDITAANGGTLTAEQLAAVKIEAVQM